MDEIAPEDYETKVLDLIKGQLKTLGTDYLDVYLYHSARYIYNDALLSALQVAKKEGLAKKVGVSVYEPDEVKKGLANGKVDFMQFPYSIFDQRMLASGIFDLPLNGTEIDTRSAFIQGLIIMGENDIPPFLAKARPIVRKIDEVCAKYNVNRVALAMNFVKQQKSISSLVFGVDNMDQLRADIDYFTKEIPDNIVNEIANEFKEIEADIVMPSLWKK
jgi:aryl-alcohol dehydrogenase-like predicted oxidoreductase